MSIAFIGIGSNLGNRENNCSRAIEMLTAKGITVLQQSTMIETEPWGVQSQPRFINLAIKVETDEQPADLLCILKNIEEEIGRTSTIRWGPRKIDLDLLLYNDLVMKTSDLEVPHPHISEREFVLRPLVEIAPDYVHPVFKKSIKELHDEMQRK